MKKYVKNRYSGNLAIQQDEVAKIIDAIMHKRTCKRSSKYFYFCRIRDSMMIIFQRFVGVRQRNVLEIEMNEIDLNSRKLYIPSHKSKSRNHEVLIFPRCITPQLRLYAAIKNRMFPESKWLFPSTSTIKGDKKVNPNTYMRMFRDALKLSGLYHVNYVDKQGHKRASKTTHGLRKGGATDVWNVTGDIIKVAIYLMHTDLRMRSTSRYIQAAKEEIREDICDMVFDRVWRNESELHKQKEKLIRLLELKQNKQVPIIKF